MTPVIVACFDPGPHTGFARFVGEQLDATRTISQHPDADTDGNRTSPAGEISDEQYRVLKALIYSLPVRAVVVIENYATIMPTGSGASGLATVKIVGWLQGNARMAGLPVALQMPAAKKPFLEEAARLVPRGADHERDAVAHGLVYFAAKRAALAKGTTDA